MDPASLIRLGMPLIKLEAMRNSIRLAVTLLLVLAFIFIVASQTFADEWMTWPSTYTHEPVQGQRVDQYAKPVQPTAPVRTDFQRSGYRSYRSTLQAGQSSDNLHIVEQWGRDVLPYEQWRFPYRPYAVPYDQWGPQAPYGIFNGANGRYPGYGPNYPRGFAPGTRPGVGAVAPGGPRARDMAPGVPPASGAYPYGYPPSRGFPLTPQYRGQPWYDGNYPSAPPIDPWTDEQFYYKPSR